MEEDEKQYDHTRQQRWIELCIVLKDLLVQDCIFTLEQYDATQVMDMKVQRYDTQAWIQRYYVDSNELKWISPISKLEDMNNPHLLQHGGQLWTCNDYWSQPVLLNMNKAHNKKLRLHKDKRIRTRTGMPVINFQPDNLCVTNRGKIYKLYHRRIVAGKYLCHLYMKRNFQCLSFWKPLRIEIMIKSLENTKFIHFQNRIFILATDQFIEIVNDDHIQTLPLPSPWPIKLQQWEWCRFNDEEILILALSSAGYDFHKFNFQNNQWTRLTHIIHYPLACGVYKLININHSVYALDQYPEETDQCILYKLDHITLTWIPINTKHLNFYNPASSLCIYTPKRM